MSAHTAFQKKTGIARIGVGGKTKGVKKLTIKALKRKPTLPQNFEDDSWKMLLAAVHAIYREEPVASSREDLYRTAEDLCMHKMSARLYSRLKAEVEIETRKLVENMSEANLASREKGDSFLVKFEGMWSNHCEHSNAIRSIFLYLDRTYVLQYAGEGIRSLWDLTVALFREAIASYPDLQSSLVKDVLSLIRDERSGESVNKTVVRKILHVFSTLSLYQKSFEPLFLEQSEGFYCAEGVRCMSEMTTPEYLTQVEKRLIEEADRVVMYMDTSTKPALMKAVEDQLLRRHMSTILSKGFNSLVERSKVAELRLLHRLFSRVSGEGLEKEAFAAYIKDTGGKIVNAKDRDKEMVQSLLDFKAQLDVVVEQAFGNEEAFAYTVKGSFEDFINLRQNKPAEMMAKYVDARLRSGRIDSAQAAGGGTPESGESEMEALLDRVMVLFRYINGKDVFEAFYKKDLAKRLLLNKSASFDLEKSMVTKLKTECGAAFTTKLEGMFKDMTLSTETMQSYLKSKHCTEYTEDCRARGVPSVGMYVHVLRTGFWPTYPPMDMTLPAVVVEGRQVFETFYAGKYQGRKLYWQHSLGTCVVKATFRKGVRHEFDVSLLQASVLLLFDQLEGGKMLSFREILDLTKIESGELKRTLQSLACGKIRPIKKRPKSKEVADTDNFVVAHDFKNSRFKLKINQIQIKETAEENQETNEKVFHDRLHTVDAVLVRIMKTRKTLSHSELMSETMSQLKFPAQGSDIKKRVESLIDREYMEREESNPQMYRYLA